MNTKPTNQTTSEHQIRHDSHNPQEQTKDDTGKLKIKKRKEQLNLARITPSQKKKRGKRAGYPFDSLH